MPKSVAVVGGGYTGLIAAYRLAKLGYAVTVMEAAKHLGGRARRAELNGQVVDNGQHLLLGAYSSLLGVLNEIHGQPAPLLTLPLVWQQWGQLHLRSYPRLGELGSLIGILLASGWSLHDKWKLLSRLVAIRLSAPPKPMMTVSEWLSDQPTRVYRYFWEPLCMAALNTPCEAADAIVFYNVIKDGLLAGSASSNLLIPRLDLSVLLPEPLAVEIESCGGEILLQKRVSGISSHEGLVTVALNDESRRFDAVVCAIAPHQLQYIEFDKSIKCSNAAIFEAVTSLSYESIRTIYLQYPSDQQLPSPMIGLHACCEGGVSQWIFDRGYFSQQAGLFAVVISTTQSIEHLSPEAIEQRVVTELQAYFPHLPAPLWVKSINEKRATFACTPARPKSWDGYCQLSDQIWLAGDYLNPIYPATLESAARSAESVAMQIHQFFSLKS